MSDWKDAFGKKLVGTEEAVSVFASGMTAVCSLTEPSGLCAALAQREDVENVTVVSAGEEHALPRAGASG